MKYRILSNDELKHFEDELIAFLVVNGIDGSTWENMNKHDPVKAVGLVEIFSDHVLEKVYSKIEYIEHRMKNSCLVFHFGEQEQALIAIQSNDDSQIDLSTTDGIHKALSEQLYQLSLFTSKRKYSTERNMEIHELLEHGAIISSKEFWNALLALTNPQ